MAGGGTTPPRCDEGAEAARKVETGEERVARRSGDPVRRHDDRAEPTRDFDHLAHDRRALDLVGVEDRPPAPVPRRTAASFHARFDSVLHAAVHALPGEGRHQMGGVAREEHAADAPSVGDARMEGVDGLALDLERVDPPLSADERANRCRRSSASLRSRRAAA